MWNLSSSQSANCSQETSQKCSNIHTSTRFSSWLSCVGNACTSTDLSIELLKMWISSNLDRRTVQRQIIDLLSSAEPLPYIHRCGVKVLWTSVWCSWFFQGGKYASQILPTHFKAWSWFGNHSIIFVDLSVVWIHIYPLVVVITTVLYFIIVSMTVWHHDGNLSIKVEWAFMLYSGCGGGECVCVRVRVGMRQRGRKMWNCLCVESGQNNNANERIKSTQNYIIHKTQTNTKVCQNMEAEKHIVFICLCGCMYGLSTFTIYVCMSVYMRAHTCVQAHWYFILLCTQQGWGQLTVQQLGWKKIV